MGRLITVCCCAAIVAALVTELIGTGGSSQGRRAITAAWVALTTSTPPTISKSRAVKLRPPPTTHPALKVDPAQLATCSQTERGVLATPTEQAFISDVVGDWRLCRTPSVFGTNEQGLEISPDGRWFKLAADSAGLPEAVRGWGNEGTWTAVDTSAMNGPGTYQLNLKIDGEGTVLTLPVFSSGPPKMRLSNDGLYTADYAPWVPRSNGT
jgi:hypothetical protein